MRSTLGAVGMFAAVAVVPLCWNAGSGVALQDSDAWAVDPEPRVRIGWDGDRPETEFFDVVAAARLPDGSIVIADRGLAQVTLVAADGSFGFAVGGPGDGPGEFASLAQVLGDDRGHVHAFDTGHQRLTEWAGEGVLVRTITVSRPGSGRRLRAVGRFESGQWYVREAPRLIATPEGRTARDTVGFFRLQEDGTVGEEIARVPGMVSTRAVVRGRPAIRHVMFSPRALDARLGDCLLVMTSDEPRIRGIDSGGGLREEIPLPIPVRRTSGADRRAWIDETIRANDAPPEMAALVEEMGRELVMAGRWPVANRILADEAGYVWLERFAAPEGPSGDWIVVDRNGDVAAELTLPDGLRLLDVEEDHVIGVRSDELGRQEVRVHALRRDRDGRESRLAGCD